MKGKTAEKTRVVGYARVSTVKQVEEGVSLEAQREKLGKYAALYELDLVAVETDAGASAKSLDRPGLQRALTRLRDGDADGLLATKLDRLTRSVRDLGDLLDDYFASGQWALLSVDEQLDTRSANGRLVLNMLTSVSAWEREVIGERTAAAMQHKAEQGEFTGGEVPFGYRLGRDGVRLEPVAEEQAAVDRACEERQAGRSLRRVAASLDAKGFRSRKGRRFAPVQVARMLRRRGCCREASRRR